MKLRLFVVLALVFAFAFTLAGNGLAKDELNANKVSKQKSPLGVTGTPTYGMLNVNNWQFWLEANGRSGYNPFSDGDGGVFPKNTSWIIFQDGFIFGASLIDSRTGLPPASEKIRVGGQTYNQGMVAGAVINGQPENQNAADVRLYRIRRDFNDLGVDLRADAADFFLKGANAVTDADIANLKAQYAKDWAEWPVQKGAPYIDRNKNGRYDPPPAGTSSRDLIVNNLDEPGIAGADPNAPANQVMWTVANDFNEANSRGLYGAAPIGLELQITAWAYQRTDALGNVVFKKYRLINRGFFKSDSFYVCQWSDPDLGDSGDDFVGCDVSEVAGKSVSLGFIYNSNSVDREYRKFNLPPPAGGYDFFQGPLVKGDPTDVGIFDLKKRSGFKNLGMSSFNYFSAGSAISDPPQTQYEGSLRWWKMLRGFIADPSTRADRKWVDPAGTPTDFPLSGDPVAKTGWIDGDGRGTPSTLPPGDRRLLLVSGPFSYAPGDTQEVVVGIVAGLGADRLSSISVMKFTDRFAQNTYDALFAVPSAPKAPGVAVRQLDGEIILEWGSDLNNVGQTENDNPAPYVFQGYNVYQFPSSASSLSEAVRLATYDLVDETTVVLDDQFDPQSGQILRLPVQLGSNSGIFRYHRVTADAVTGRPRLRNGQEYYFGVTAYSVSTDPFATPLTLESSPVILRAIPQSPNPGTRYQTSIGKEVANTHSAGIADASVMMKVIDPTKVTGSSYELRVVVTDSIFIDADLDPANGDETKVPNPKWQLVRGGNVILPASTDFKISDANPIGEGLQVGISGAPFWVAGTEIAYQAYAKKGQDINTVRNVSASNWSPVNWGGNFYSGGLDVGYNFFGSTLLPYQVTKTIEIRFNAADGQNAYNFVRQATGGSGGSPYAGFFPQPFKVFDVTNPASPRQIDFAIMEQFDQPTLNNVWNPGTAAGNREYFFIIDEDYTPTAKAEYTGKTLGFTADKPVLYAGWYVVTDGTKPPYEDGDVWRIKATNLITAADRWTFSTAGMNPTFSAETQKADLNKINVFPNPYYALNSAETNRFVRFVTFNFMPEKATVRIFNVAGQLVRILEKNDTSQFLRWDLNNQNNFPVASGMYIAHIDMPETGATKVLKLAVIQEQEVLEVF
jgi:hypothetical protein